MRSKPVDLAGVDVGADDLVARFRETRADDQADVARSDDADVHNGAPLDGSAHRIPRIGRERHDARLRPHESAS